MHLECARAACTPQPIEDLRTQYPQLLHALYWGSKSFPIYYKRRPVYRA